MASESIQPVTTSPIEELKPIAPSAIASVEVKPPADQSLPRVVYAVCIGTPHDLTVPAGLCGFESDQRVGVDIVGNLGVLTIAIDAAYFTGADAEERLADLAWVAPRAVRHEELIRMAGQAGPVMPLPFGTIFSSAVALHSAITPVTAPIHEYLERVRGCVELGFRVAVDRSVALSAHAKQVLSSRDLPTSPGARYLMQKRLTDEAQRTLDAALRAQVAELIVAIEPLTRGVVARRPATDRGDGLETIGLFALLVADEAVPSVRERVGEIAAALREHGLHLEITGPWSTYSFCPSLGATS